MTDYAAIRRRIKREAQVIKVATTLGAAVTITKRQAYALLDTLERRMVEPSVTFDEIHDGKYLVVIDQARQTL